MKTIRTIIATLSAVLLTFALAAWISVRRNAAFIQRTIYQGFDQTFVVALVMGCAFLLIAIILTVAIVSTDEDGEDEEDEEPVRPQRRSQAPAQKRPAADREELPYRRVTRTRTMAPTQTSGEEDGFARPKARAEGKPAPKKRPQAAQRPDDVTLRGEETPVRKAKKKASAPATPPVSETAAEVPVKGSEALAEPPVEPAATLPADAPEAPAKAPTSETEPVKAAETPAAPETEPEASAEAPTPETEPETPAEAPTPETPAAPETEPEAPAAEGTVRCIFCGSEMSRDSQICPNCGKKR